MTASWYCLCIDVYGPGLGEFWATAVGGTLQARGQGPDGFDWIEGPEGLVAVWSRCRRSKTVKHRVHLDLHVRSLDELTDIGATVVLPAEESGFQWTVLQDPQGGEFCAFVQDEPPALRLYEVVVDCRDPETIARWWADRFGVKADSRGHQTPSGGSTRSPACRSRTSSSCRCPSPRR